MSIARTERRNPKLRQVLMFGLAAVFSLLALIPLVYLLMRDNSPAAPNQGPSAVRVQMGGQSYLLVPAD
jgi:hypothetical protein